MTTIIVSAPAETSAAAATAASTTTARLRRMPGQHAIKAPGFPEARTGFGSIVGRAAIRVVAVSLRVVGRFLRLVEVKDVLRGVRLRRGRSADLQYALEQTVLRKQVTQANRRSGSRFRESRW